MREQAAPGVLPLRPLTTGELLDAAVVLLRSGGGRLIRWAALLALLEQIILYVLRRAADVDSGYLPATGRLAQYGVLVVVGIGTEVFCIALLGAAASRRAPAALLGSAAPAPPPPRSAAVVVVAVLAAGVCAASAWAFLVLPVPLQVIGLFLAALATAFIWPIAYGMVGLAAPAVVLDRLSPPKAMLRSIRLASRDGMRAGGIRVLGYLAWLLIRLGLGLAAVAAVTLFYQSPSTTVDNLVTGSVWLVVNTLAYPVLGCLDVCLHLETRMRTEGLDIALGRALRRGVSAEAALAVPR